MPSFCKWETHSPEGEQNSSGPLREEVAQSFPGPRLPHCKLRVISRHFFVSLPVHAPSVVHEGRGCKGRAKQGPAWCHRHGSWASGWRGKLEMEHPIYRGQLSPSTSGPGWDASPTLTQLLKFPRQVGKANSYVKSPNV